MLLVLSKSWSVLAYRGTTAIGFGISAVLWPQETVRLLVPTFGWFALFDGAVHAWFACRISAFVHRAWLVWLRSGVGVILGLIALLFPVVVLAGLLHWIAGWAFATGGLEIAQGVWLRREEHRERLLLLLGFSSVLLGGLLALRSPPIPLGALGLLAGYSLAIGLLLLSLAARLRTLTHRLESTCPELWAAARL